MSASCIVYRVADRSFLWRTIPSLQQLPRQRSHVTASCVHIIRVSPRMRPLRYTQSRLMVINFSSFCTTSCPSFGHTFALISLFLCNLLLTSCRNEDWGTGCKCRHFWMAKYVTQLDRGCHGIWSLYCGYGSILRKRGQNKRNLMARSGRGQESCALETECGKPRARDMTCTNENAGGISELQEQRG